MEPSLEAEPKVPPEPDTGAKKNAERTAPELAILKGAADDPARMVGVVMSIKRRRRARERGAREFAKEAAHDLFMHHYEEVQRSWGSPIDEEEAVGYLVADALALELVP